MVTVSPTIQEFLRDGCSSTEDICFCILKSVFAYLLVQVLELVVQYSIILDSASRRRSIYLVLGISYILLHQYVLLLRLLLCVVKSVTDCYISFDNLYLSK